MIFNILLANLANKTKSQLRPLYEGQGHFMKVKVLMDGLYSEVPLYLLRTLNSLGAKGSVSTSMT